MVDTGNPDSAFGKQIRIQPVLFPVEFAGFRLDIAPAQALADHLDTGAACNLGDYGESVRRPERILLLRRGQPALRGVDGEKQVRIFFPFFRVGDHGEAAAAGDSGDFELVVTVWKSGQSEAGAGKIFFPDDFVLPVAENPASIVRRSGIQGETQFLPLQKGGAGRCRRDRVSVCRFRSRSKKKNGGSENKNHLSHHLKVHTCLHESLRI